MEFSMKIALDDLFRGKSVSLLGAGVSNMPLAGAAVPSAAKLTVRDKKSPEELGEAAEQLQGLGAELITGDAYLAGIREDLVFRSPGIRPDLPELTDAMAHGSVLTSEMELFLSLEPCPVYAITGSDGKTTTTTITSLLLEAGLGKEHVFLGGNIGEPLLHRYPKITADDVVAVELSSFQLMTVDAPVEVAAITNMSPNHLNWHTDMDEYVWAKKRLLAKCGRAVLNYDNDLTREAAFEMQKTDTPVTFFSLAPIPAGVLRDIDSAVWLEDGVIYSDFPGEGVREVMKRSDIRLPGIHNTANFMTAIAVTHGKVSYDDVRTVAQTFGGVEHRLEFVRELDGVTYINGSIDSSPTRTAAALSALNDRPVVLIVGGSDKNLDYAPFAETVFASTVHTLVLTGATMEKVYAAVTEAPGYADAAAKGLKIVKNPSFDGAVADARAAAKAGDTVILSPAAASFDAFPNFMVRGRHFKELVMAF
jgi:UDP-N-acetylmuramoylalanine--D-glutamate ligase